MRSEILREAASVGIHSLVQKRYREAQQAFPDVRLDPDVFVRKIMAVLRKHLPQQLQEDEFELAATQFLDGLKWEALFLTTACASGDEVAWRIFHSRYSALVHKTARYCSENYSQAQDLSESLMSELFLPMSTESGAQTSKISQYDGIGSLEGWIKVVLSRLAIDQIRRSQRQVSLNDLEADLSSSRVGRRENAAGADLDLPRASRMFLISLDHAMEQLNSQEKLILRMYFLNNISLREIGTVLRVHESTVSRTLDRIKKQLRKSVERYLREHFRLRSAEVPQLIETVHLEVDVDLKGMLTE